MVRLRACLEARHHRLDFILPAHLEDYLGHECCLAVAGVAAQHAHGLCREAELVFPAKEAGLPYLHRSRLRDVEQPVEARHRPLANVFLEEHGEVGRAVLREKLVGVLDAARPLDEVTAGWSQGPSEEKWSQR